MASATGGGVPAAHAGLLGPHPEYLRSWAVSRGTLALLRKQQEELAAAEQKMRAAERAHAAELSEQAAAPELTVQKGKGKKCLQPSRSCCKQFLMCFRSKTYM